MDAEGSRSEGFRIKQLPAASAVGNIHIGTMAGKLKGVMPATTPSGWRVDHESTLVPTFSVYSPLSKVGAAVANSTTSAPRCTSPSASDKTLPCSAVIQAASSLARESIMPRNLFKMRERRSGVVLAQAGKAARAACTATSISAVVASTSSPDCSPVAGLNTADFRMPLPATSLPLIQ